MSLMHDYSLQMVIGDSYVGKNELAAAFSVQRYVGIDLVRSTRKRNGMARRKKTTRQRTKDKV